MVETPFFANRMLSLLRQAFAQAVRWGWRAPADNPAKSAHDLATTALGAVVFRLVNALADELPGTVGSAPFVGAGGVLYAGAFRKDAGVELFHIDISDYPSRIFSDGFENGDSLSWSSTSP